MKRWLFPLAAICLLMLVIVSMYSIPVCAKENSGQEEDIYDTLQESINESWENGFEDLETENEIEIEGPLTERIIRGIANTFYQHLVEIKAWSLIIGLISMLCGIFIAVTARLNKKLRRFAVIALIITIPGLLTGFVFGITKLISIFI